MEEVEVEVLKTEVLEGVLDGESDVLGVVVQLEELGGDPELLAGDTGGLDTLSDLGLVTWRVSPPISIDSSAFSTVLELKNVKKRRKSGTHRTPRHNRCA